MSIAIKLAKIQRDLKAPKKQYNKFGGYFYRNCEDILEAVKLVAGDMAVTLTDDIVMIGDRHYVKAVATITDGEHSMSATAYAREAEMRKGMDDSQVTGSASSYARKYALNGLFAIDDARDHDDQQGVVQSGKTHTEPPSEKTAAENAKQSLVRCLTLAELQEAWELLPPNLKKVCTATKDQQKTRIENEKLTGA